MALFLTALAATGFAPRALVLVALVEFAEAVWTGLALRVTGVGEPGHPAWGATR
jgi:hypothetical protein